MSLFRNSPAVTRATLIVLRLIAAVGGGYAVSAGLAAFAAVGLPMATSLPRSEAVVLASMLAFLIYLAVLIWGFAERRLGRLYGILVLVAAASWGSALGLARLVPAS
jgi:hypothetical protein